MFHERFEKENISNKMLTKVWNEDENVVDGAISMKVHASRMKVLTVGKWDNQLD